MAAEDALVEWRGGITKKNLRLPALLVLAARLCGCGAPEESCDGPECEDLAVDELEARGGNGGSRISATLDVTPNPVPANDFFHFSGCGHGAGTGVMLNVWGSGIATTGTVADASGCIAGDWGGFAAGSYTLKASIGRRYQNVVASVAFEVL